MLQPIVDLYPCSTTPKRSIYIYICMMMMMMMIMMRMMMIRSRMHAAVSHQITKTQYGFRPRMSYLDVSKIMLQANLPN